MSDEESFVILGTSPTPSMDTINSLPIASISSDMSETIKAEVAPLNGMGKINGSEINQSQLTSSSSSGASQYSIVPNHNGTTPKTTNGESDVDGALIADCVSSTPQRILTTVAPVSIENSMPSKTESHGANSNGIDATVAPNSVKHVSPDPSLAASFILGEVNSDILKASVYSQFPSICSMGACSEDMMKLQNMMSEYMELKKTLLDTNITMKHLYDQTQKWKAEQKAMENDRKVEIAKLRNENLELRRELELKIEQMNITEKTRRKEHEEFIQSLSEKTSQIENMSTQIQKLEQQQMGSSANQTDETAESAAVTEYVTTAEHRRVVKDFERQMSVIVAENLELKDMQKLYIDEINCLKVNLVAAEELLKQSEEDIKFLKASDVEKSEIFNKFEAERKSLRVDLDVVTQQLEIYSRDFKMEQEARENLANERDQLLSDLRELQKKNQVLIEEAQKNYEEHTKLKSATGAFPKTRTSQSTSTSTSPKSNIYSPEYTYNCPLCGQIFKTLCILQTHVNQCLDGN